MAFALEHIKCFLGVTTLTEAFPKTHPPTFHPANLHKIQHERPNNSISLN